MTLYAVSNYLVWVSKWQWMRVSNGSGWVKGNQIHKITATATLSRKVLIPVHSIHTKSVLETISNGSFFRLLQTSVLER